MHASPGDYIITGIYGEHYPCKPDIFNKTYDEVQAEDCNYIPVQHPLLTSDNTEVYVIPKKEFNSYHNFLVRNVHTGDTLTKINFQKGPVKENGLNGIFHEDLIGMIILRLEEFQKSEWACKENEMALQKLNEALMWLRKRTTDRQRRGVIGTMKK